MIKTGAVYIMTNWNNHVLYTGVTSRLKERAYEHRTGLVPGFTQRYNCTRLVYYELFSDMYLAIQREKQVKNYSRQKKIDLVNALNPDWRDLYEEI